MVILVSDTSVLVDLERGGLLEAAFASGLSMAVPDLLYERELAEHNGRYLQSLGLAVVSMTPAEVALAQSLHTNRRALSLADCFALSCATRQGHTLVTADKTLRAEAESRQLTVMDQLGLFDRIADALGRSK
jgi:predicted nucleic acid-binding protein